MPADAPAVTAFPSAARTIMNELDLPIRAALETAAGHGVRTDRCDILQNGHTLVLRLSETLVARVVTDRDGPRQGGAWYARETGVARHLAERGAPVIPVHPELPPGPHEHLGYTLNFWQYVTRVAEEPSPEAVGRTLHECHTVLRDCPEPLPEMAILTETLALLETLEKQALFPPEILELLRGHLEESLEILATHPRQPLHGDAHEGNLMNTTLGLLWTDWEDTFLGPVEWDVASIIWNPKVLEGNEDTASRIVTAYRAAGGAVDEAALQQCLVARAAVMSAWYPILYPQPDESRRRKLAFRLEWLRKMKK
ncbi:phosphotransferase [Luteolibacter ambystomatis]|uniref:Phosphotransferase n=1 Tax=Luteolibacter ambystomatis TaxID=2824561 RepID=A0A975G6Y3_9BACT|nr:phosphotransferase [Luteolibacter ambystomatis]QUE49911.1 phosphotransferase [Luteolibacter ambystomatis]